MCETPSGARGATLRTSPQSSTMRSQRQAPRPHPTTSTAHAAKRSATGTGKPQEVRTPSPALRHSNTAMAEPVLVPSGSRSGGVRPRGNPPATPRQEGAPLPADRYGPSRPARLRMEVARRGGTTASQTPGSPHYGTCPRTPWPIPPKPSKRASRRPSPPAQPGSAACRRGWPGYAGERRTDARARAPP